LFLIRFTKILGTGEPANPGGFSRYNRKICGRLFRYHPVPVESGAHRWFFDQHFEKLLSKFFIQIILFSTKISIFDTIFFVYIFDKNFDFILILILFLLVLLTRCMSCVISGTSTDLYFLKKNFFLKTLSGWESQPLPRHFFDVYFHGGREPDRPSWEIFYEKKSFFLSKPRKKKKFNPKNYAGESKNTYIQ